jgi:hypothetical protein
MMPKATEGSSHPLISQVLRQLHSSRLLGLVTTISESTYILRRGHGGIACIRGPVLRHYLGHGQSRVLNKVAGVCRC